MPSSHSEPIEAAGVDEIRTLQLQRLRETARRVYENVPAYRQKFEAAGVHPDDLRETGDIAKFPFTAKEDLRAAFPFGLFAVPAEAVVRVHASSGTTGKPTVVGYTKADIDNWAAIMARSIRAAGGRPGDRFQIALGYGLFTGGLGFHYGAERLGCMVIPAAAGMTERQLRMIEDFRPQVIAATPSYLLTIADEFERQGKDGSATSLRIAMCGAEPWSETMRSEIERRLGLDAFDTYGLSEVIGPGVAQETGGRKDGPTVWEDHFYPEIIDPESGRALPDGEAGELVLTTLTSEAMPVIRYRTRDLTRLLPGDGNGMRRLERIRGRSDDMLIIRGVNLFPSQIEELLAEERYLSAHYILEVSRPKRLDELDVVVEIRPEAAGSITNEEQTALERRTEHLIKARIGVAASVRIVPPQSLERSPGKAKRIIDLRRKD